MLIYTSSIGFSTAITSSWIMHLFCRQTRETYYSPVAHLENLTDLNYEKGWLKSLPPSVSPVINSNMMWATGHDCYTTANVFDWCSVPDQIQYHLEEYIRFRGRQLIRGLLPHNWFSVGRLPILRNQKDLKMRLLLILVHTNTQTCNGLCLILLRRGDSTKNLSAEPISKAYRSGSPAAVRLTPLGIIPTNM